MDIITDLNPEAEITIRKLEVENLLLKGICSVLFILFVIVVVIFVITVFYDNKKTKSMIKDIKKGQHALFEKIYEHKKTKNEKKSTPRYKKW